MITAAITAFSGFLGGRGMAFAGFAKSNMNVHEHAFKLLSSHMTSLADLWKV
jgi:hypothetical protein